MSVLSRLAVWNRPPHRRTIVILTAVAGAAAVLVVGTFVAILPGHDGDRSRGRSVVSIPDRSTPADWTAVAGLDGPHRLDAFAAQLHTTDADASRGRYTCVHLQEWSGATGSVQPVDTVRCRAEDGSGQQTDRILPPRPGLLPLPDGRDRDRFPTAAPTTRTYPPGTMHIDVPEPVPTDPAALRDALSGQPSTPTGGLAWLSLPSGDPAWLANRIADLETGQYLDRVQRAAALRVLAGIPGVAYTGPVTDLAGRAGVTFTVTGNIDTLTLTFDADTGALLAFLDVVPSDATRRPASQARPGLRVLTLVLTGQRRALPADAEPTVAAGSAPRAVRGSLRPGTPVVFTAQAVR